MPMCLPSYVSSLLPSAAAAADCDLHLGPRYVEGTVAHLRHRDHVLCLAEAHPGGLPPWPESGVKMECRDAGVRVPVGEDP